MNKLLNKCKKLYYFSHNFFETISGLVNVILFSSIKCSIDLFKFRKKQNKKIVHVIGNGPSLANELETNIKSFVNEDVMCVNYFANNELFNNIRPKYYLFVDPIVFTIKSKLHEKNLKLIESLNSVSWEMHLFIPYLQRKSEIIIQLTNKNIVIHFYNNSMIKGFRNVRHFLYKLNLGIPSSRNVSIPSIFNMINMNYREIHIYGMDHSWFKSLFVDQNNQLYEDDRHFFSKDNKNIVTKNVNMAKLMAGYSLVFEAHMLLNDYAVSKKIKILNHSQNSFIDAYQKV